MNLTIGSSNIGHVRNNIKSRYIASAAAAVLVFSAVAGLSGALKSSTASQASSAPQVSSAFSDTKAHVAPLRVYVAETPEPAAAVEQEQLIALNYAASNGLPLPEPATIVVKGSVFEQDLLSASGTVIGTGRPVAIISGSSLVMTSAAQPMFATAADADFAAGALVPESALR